MNVPETTARLRGAFRGAGRSRSVRKPGSGQALQMLTHPKRAVKSATVIFRTPSLGLLS